MGPATEPCPHKECHIPVEHAHGSDVVYFAAETLHGAIIGGRTLRDSGILDRDAHDDTPPDSKPCNATAHTAQTSDYQLVVQLPENASNELRNILMEQFPDWYELFCEKNAGYQNDRGSVFELGVRGQYSDMHRKFMKLKRFMWDEGDDKIPGEQLDEILRDMIGHCFLTLAMLDMDV